MRKTIILFMALFAMTASAGNPVKGVDRNNLDPEAAPGENFYQYACGGWMIANPLDPQYARFGTFDQLRENCRNQVKDIITTLGTNNPRGSVDHHQAVFLNGFGYCTCEFDFIASLRFAERE